MKVVLLRDIYKTGVAGEIVEVANGYARNYLIPRGMALQATKSNLKSQQRLLAEVEARRIQYENLLNEVARKIDGVEIFFERRAAQTGKLFGSVTTQEIADALNEATSIDINRRRISPQGLRELGVHTVNVRLGNELAPKLVVTIVREGELAEYMAKREAAAQGVEEATTEAEEAYNPADYGVVEAVAEVAEEVTEAVAPEAVVAPEVVEAVEPEAPESEEPASEEETR